MNLRCVTITGADDSVWPIDLAQLHDAFLKAVIHYLEQRHGQNKHRMV